MTNLLLELGMGFAFMGRQHHLAVGDEGFCIDLLFYNPFATDVGRLKLQQPCFRKMDWRVFSRRALS